MRIFQSLLRRLRSLRERDTKNVELDEELRFHLERQVEENIAGGMAPGQARAAAMAGFGSVTEAAEDCYEARGVGWIEDFVQDVRYGWRTLIKHRSFTFVIVLTLALGIGACTAIFSLVNAVLIRSLPYGAAKDLVYLYTPNAQYHLPVEIFGPSNADFFDLKTQSHSYADMTLFSQSMYNLAADDRSARVGAAKVDAEFFRTLQSAPELGRAIASSDEQLGQDRVVMISDALWQEMFGGESEILGRTLRLDGTPYRVIGVMPKGFTYPNKSDLIYGNGKIDTTQIWVPSALTSQQRVDRDASNGYAVARLKPGVGLNEAQAEISAVMPRLDRLHRADLRGWGGLVKPFRENALGPVRPLMWLLLGAVGFVLLIACGNAANLLLARAANRTHELGVRATLGAGRGRLVRQMLTECLMVSVASGLLGVGLAYLFLRALLRLDPGDIPRMQDATLDMHVMGFVVFVTVLTGFLFGILPSHTATRVNPVELLKSGGMRGVMGDRRRVRNGLAIAQVALVVMLLTGAGLFLRSYLDVLSVQTGFSASTVAANVELGTLYSPVEKRHAFFEDLMARMRAVPGVQAVGLVNDLPLSDSESLSKFWVEGYPNVKEQLVEGRGVTPGYLSAMETPVLEGRGFTGADDHGAAPVAIVNEAFRKKYFAGREAVGGHLRMSTTAPWTTVVGVAEDVRNESLEVAAVPQAYIPFWQMERNNPLAVSAYLAVRSTLPEEVVAGEIRAAVRGLDPTLAVSDVHAMGELEAQASSPRRFQTTLLTVFSAIAMLLAVIGVYGLLAYSVRQRTGEIGLRMALGSSRGRAAMLVLREGLLLLGAGLLVGLGGALAMARLLGRFLYGVPPFDPVTFVLVPVVLLLATLCACVVPSWRAAAVDPMDALRHQ